MFDSAGKPTLFTKRIQIAIHEAFHRLMKRHFTKADIAVMKDAQGEIKQIAMMVRLSLRTRYREGSEPSPGL